MEISQYEFATPTKDVKNIITIVELCVFFEMSTTSMFCWHVTLQPWTHVEEAAIILTSRRESHSLLSSSAL